MAVDFTVIIRVRQRFGDFQPDVSGLEMNAPWVGEEKEFAFQCPNVDSSQEAILLFQAQGAQGSTLEINGHAVSGAIHGGLDVILSPTSPPETIARARWNRSSHCGQGSRPL
jgi:hypothetical protein